MLPKLRNKNLGTSSSVALIFSSSGPLSQETALFCFVVERLCDLLVVFDVDQTQDHDNIFVFFVFFSVRYGIVRGIDLSRGSEKGAVTLLPCLESAPE